MYSPRLRLATIHKRLIPAALAALILAGNLQTAAAAGPSISITSPKTNSIQQKTINLTATAGTGTLGVTFKVNGPGVAKTFTEDKTAPYSVSWDTNAGLNKVDYTITAVARGTSGSTTSAPVKIKLDNIPTPNTVTVTGDRLSQQTFDADANGTFAYTSAAPAASNLLASAETINASYTASSVQTVINNYSIFRWPQRLVMAMGIKDASPLAGGDGWTEGDAEKVRTLVNTVHSTACVVVVLPGHGSGQGAGANPVWNAEIDEARASLAQIAAQRPRTLVIDWQQVIDQHPEYLDEDGIHLPTPGTLPAEDLALEQQGKVSPVDQTAANARQNFYWEGVSRCADPVNTFQTPANNAVVSDNLSLALNVSNTDSVQFLIDGQNLGAPVTASPFQITWNTAIMPSGAATTNGNHIISAVSSNSIGSHTASISVNVQNPPVPDSVGLIGDSVTYNAINSSNVWYEQIFYGNKPANLVFSYWPGFTHADSLADVRAWSAKRTPQILVDADGINDSRPPDPVWAGTDGFTTTDKNNILATLNAVHASSCKVLVLPGWGKGLGTVPKDSNPADDAATLDYELKWIQELQKVRSYYAQLASQRTDIVLVDWQPIVNQYPYYMDADGIHLAPKANGQPGWRTDAAQARQNLYWNGVAQCRTRLGI